MADDWMKLRLCLFDDHPILIRAARILGVDDPDYVLAKFLRVWARADRQTVDGCFHGLTAEDVDGIANFPRVGEAMVAVGWAEQGADGFRLLRYEEHNGRNTKRRLLDAQRKNPGGVADGTRKSRGKKTERLRNKFGTKPEGSRKDVGTGSDQEQEREEEQEQESPPTPPPGGAWGGGLPPNLDTTDFRRTWIDWLTYRGEARQPTSDLMLRRQLAQLATWGEAAAIASIEQSIRNGWSMLKDPRTVAGPRKETREEQLARVKAEMEGRGG